MGLDGSETRLCDYRCWPLLDDMNNWVANLPVPPKYVQAIAEVYQQGPGDDIYANTPVNYVHIPAVPASDDFSPVIGAMRKGDYFVSENGCAVKGRLALPDGVSVQPTKIKWLE
jgi:hypothetical protein